MDPLLDSRADIGSSPKAGRMTLDQAFAALGWGVDDWPSELEVRKRHKELQLKYHPDKAAEGMEEHHTEISSRLNRAKEVILRAHGLKNVHSDETLNETENPISSSASPSPSSKQTSARTPKTASTHVHTPIQKNPSPHQISKAAAAHSTKLELSTPTTQKLEGPLNRREKLDGRGAAADDGRDQDIKPQSVKSERKEEEGAGNSGSLQRLRNFFDVNEMGKAGTNAAHPHSVWGEDGGGGGGGGESAAQGAGENERGSNGRSGEQCGKGAGGEAREGRKAAAGGREVGEAEAVGGSWEYVTRGSVTPTFQDISSHLRLLGQLRDGDKLVVTGDTIAIDSSWVFGGISRFLTSQGRGPTASWLLRFAADVSRFATALLSGMGQSVGPGRSGVHGRGAPSLSQEEVLSAVVRELKGAIEGLGRLRATYAADFRTSSQLAKVIDSLSETLHLLSRPSHRPAPPRRPVPLAAPV